MTHIHEDKHDDQFLVKRVLDGDTSAFSIIIRNTERLVTQIIFKMIATEEDRKDLAQEVYLKAFKNLKGFQFQSKLSTWIAQITYNACINHLRKKKLTLVDNDAWELDDTEILQSKEHSAWNEMESFILNKEMIRILQFEIEKLPSLYKTIITLYHNEELSYKEITEITGLPAGTLKNYLFRARKILRDRIALHYKKEPL
ncbi:RNA polymerase subunit sigma-24 [Niastella vici]|uniref:RNA polymerase subunit sigma-24 n=1 Tax=Niastella vici TaxID=1703345 RepID=A0A1V9G0Z3_9BACT|nr:sigma-70 family RNA polymerase sigma factor [Niastella vici]OQP64273.1 RNA polymerase subunit sigma-24 [Niastella vici]